MGKGQHERSQADSRPASRIMIKDWVGRKFGDLEVIAYDGRRNGKHYWRCRCSCGAETVANQSNLQDGHTRSCGCKSKPASTRHFVEGTCIESIRSRKVSVSNRSGIRGVYRNRKNGRWVAQITFQGRTRYLGSFGDLEEAARARAEAEKIFEAFLEKYENPGAQTAAGTAEDLRQGMLADGVESGNS
ncbi:MAG TPA: hypothetical protein DCZ91_12160 [Lachnospiraceae bacterium]|nr:hypothetical protein [Lachnospiraceae bacterium]